MDYFHSRDLRKGRYSEIDRPYLITTTTSERLPFFGNYDLGKLVVNEIHHLENRQWVDSICWVVMPDHLHWLFVLRRGMLDRVIQSFKSRSGLSINRRLGRTGKIWQPGFHDRALRRDEDIKKVARYIVANPLRAGLVQNIMDYPLWDAVWIERGADLTF
ncbi:MAG TPA: transposase [Gammaproteobacteria bacterium]|nr:transposase [Gammaproteobacteria bacterium]